MPSSRESARIESASTPERPITWSAASTMAPSVSDLVVIGPPRSRSVHRKNSGYGVRRALPVDPSDAARSPRKFDDGLAEHLPVRDGVECRPHVVQGEGALDVRAHAFRHEAVERGVA